ncbi:ATP synthase subunit s, mitochondrial isoform X1 [Oryzias latipes]|uniref:ATP synthase subunit s, mitochondrial isoform X1 n=1 Tax=Oryzias latipes TaxID=8090 RepID=UPI0005CBD0F7|nr:ATP synthase subunit s, mitochondrial isoform X1 [Oryzias latipes]
MLLLLPRAVTSVCSREGGRRHFWGWLNAVFNKVDHDRIKAVGPDRAAAEWLLRCGAKVRFRGFDRWHLDYNALPTGPLDRGSAARGGDQTLQVRLHPGRLSGAAERRGEPAAESAQHGGGVVWKRDGQGRGRPAPAQESGVSVSQRSSWNKRQTVDRGQTAEGAASPGRHSGPGLMLHRRSETQSCFFFFSRTQKKLQTFCWILCTLLRCFYIRKS